MPSKEDVFIITLKILGDDMKIPVKRCDEQYFRESAKLIGTVYEKYTMQISSAQNNFGVETYLKLVALDLGVRYRMAEAANEELRQRLEQLEKDIDQHLD